MTSFDKLIEIVARLREPACGCPWDLKQTPESLVPNFIEELYECVEAIEEQDYKSLREELGDLMLHIVFQCQIAAEEQRFNADDVLNAINSKLIRRHPHVFGELEIAGADAVKMNWERIKKAEKKERISVLEGIPRALPGLIYAQRTQEKAASVGFDWQDHQPVMAKLHEEIAELNQAIENEDEANIQEEVGDLLFTIVNLARKLHVDAESAVKATTRKFTSRFQYIEEHYRNNNEDINNATLEELDTVWEKAKDL
jgi:MazG family protein